jgi:hypothetical protein
LHLTLAEVVGVSKAELLLEVGAARLARHQEHVLVEPLPQVPLVVPSLVFARHQTAFIVLLVLLFIDDGGVLQTSSRDILLLFFFFFLV